MNQAWYVLQVKPGREIDTMAELRRSGIYTVLPRAMYWIRSSGNWFLRERLIIPGYLFVQIELDDSSYYLLTAPNDVIRILGAGGRPVPLTEKEVSYIEWLANDGKAIEPTRVCTRFFAGRRRAVQLDGFLYPVRYYLQFDWHRRLATYHFPMRGEMHKISLPITPQ